MEKKSGDKRQAIGDKPEAGILYVVGTPIGNLEDVTLRALRILKEVDLIAAEDTRRTRKLLSKYDIHTPLTSYHEHSKITKGEFLISGLKEGKGIALVADSGMPGISDPGYHLVQLALREKISIVPIPGPTALISGLVISGLPARSFVFEGFLPSKQKARRDKLFKLKPEPRTIVLYEAPHRLLDTLRDILDILGDRKIAVARELTKKFEEVIRDRASKVLEFFGRKEPRGEFTIVIEGASEAVVSSEAWSGLSIVDHIKLVMKEKGLSKKEAVKEVARERKISKREVYQASLGSGLHS